MTLIESVGFIAASCTTFSFLPQAIRVIKTRDTRSLSLIMYAMFTFGVAMWGLYGYFINDLAMILANIITFIFAASILTIKIYNTVQGIDTIKTNT